MLNNYRMGNTFSDSYKFTRNMFIMRYNNLDECDKFADYKMKDTFKLNSRISTISGIKHDNKLFEDKITDYKIYRKQCER